MTIQNLAQPLECYCDLMTSFNSFVYMSNLIAIIQHSYFRTGVICSDMVFMMFWHLIFCTNCKWEVF